MIGGGASTHSKCIMYINEIICAREHIVRRRKTAKVIRMCARPPLCRRKLQPPPLVANHFSPTSHTHTHSMCVCGLRTEKDDGAWCIVRG